jgi:Fe-S cluster biogenesis protein NfuA
MPSDDDVGARIDALLAELSSGVRGPDAAALGEQLVTTVVADYGDGLARIVELLDAETVARLATDPLVQSLLVLHDLHPQSLPERIEAALTRVQPKVGSPVRLQAITADGVAQLQMSGGRSGCPSSTRAVLEEAVLGAAPELVGVDVEEGPKLLQIGLRRQAVG